MAENDERLETLEDEVKVLKGEVKRTLVDLRALLMREDSPLSPGALARRSAAASAVGENLPRRESAAAMLPETVNVAAFVVKADNADSPATEELDEMPFQTSTAEHSSGIFEEQLATKPGRKSPGLAGGLAGLEAGAAPGMGFDLPGMGPGPGPGFGLEPAAVPLDLPGAPPAGFAPAVPPLVSDAKLTISVAPVSLADRAATTPRAGMAHLQTATVPEEEDLMVGDEELVHQLSSLNGNGNGHGNGHGQGRSEIPEPEEAGTNAAGTRNRVYAEYQDLLRELPESYPLEDNSVGPAVDINLLSSLVHWTTLARQRVGEQQIKSILDLYIQSGHSSPALQELILNISGMVETVPSLGRESPHEWMDLMFCLHGILTGGMPVVKVPQIRLPVSGDRETRQDI
jgi:hypothetical protein